VSKTDILQAAFYGTDILQIMHQYTVDIADKANFINSKTVLYLTTTQLGVCLSRLKQPIITLEEHVTCSGRESNCMRRIKVAPMTVNSYVVKGVHFPSNRDH